ncbi:MAG: DUF1801 domain-containing protein [Chloroflexota bacterium]
MSPSPSELIDRQIAGLPDWRGELMTNLRRIISQADPNLQEDWKWDTAVWAAKGNVCAIGAFKESVKLNFFKGASLPDPQHLFNGGLEAKASRSIDLKEGDSIDRAALQELIRAAVAHNTKR